MATDQRAALREIKTFPQLIAYLRDVMNWPIEKDSFEDVDDLFYDYTAEELGIDAKNAAKIRKIKRLRPLTANQPWGIFFVEFTNTQWNTLLNHPRSVKITAIPDGTSNTAMWSEVRRGLVAASQNGTSTPYSPALVPWDVVGVKSLAEEPDARFAAGAAARAVISITGATPGPGKRPD